VEPSGGTAGPPAPNAGTRERKILSLHTRQATENTRQSKLAGFRTRPGQRRWRGQHASAAAGLDASRFTLSVSARLLRRILDDEFRRSLSSVNLVWQRWATGPSRRASPWSGRSPDTTGVGEAYPLAPELIASVSRQRSAHPLDRGALQAKFGFKEQLGDSAWLPDR